MMSRREPNFCHIFEKQFAKAFLLRLILFLSISLFLLRKYYSHLIIESTFFHVFIHLVQLQATGHKVSQRSLLVSIFLRVIIINPLRISAGNGSLAFSFNVTERYCY